MPIGVGGPDFNGTALLEGALLSATWEEDG